MYTKKEIKALESASEFNVHRIAAETIALYQKIICDYKAWNIKQMEEGEQPDKR